MNLFVNGLLKADVNLENSVGTNMTKIVLNPLNVDSRATATCGLSAGLATLKFVLTIKTADNKTVL